MAAVTAVPTTRTETPSKVELVADVQTQRVREARLHDGPAGSDPGALQQLGLVDRYGAEFRPSISAPAVL